MKKKWASLIRSRESAIRDWYASHAEKAPPPFYCSIDLRDSGHKIVPVDSNLFPAGFNNICPDDLRTAPEIVKNHLERIGEKLKLPQIKRVMIIPESHTSNTYYIENLYYLRQILLDAGFEVEVGWAQENLDPDLKEIKLISFTQKEIIARPFSLLNGYACIGEFTPDIILLNNDFSAGYPKILEEIKQPIVPDFHMGWHTRRKSSHFKYYNSLATEFAQLLGMNPWPLLIDTESVDQVNFNEEVGTDQVAEAVERILARTKSAYEAHDINQKPFAFIKNNAGTYGMGIMVVHSADEIRTMNRRTKNKMSVGKNRSQISSVVVQEGVPTATIVDRLAAEPVIYLVGCDLIGGFLRTNTEKGAEDNLNSQGMVFRKLCMSDLRLSPDDEELTEEPILEIVYGAVARISALATGYEIKAQSESRK